MIAHSIIHLFRKKNPIFFSIEKVFSVIENDLLKRGITIKKIELPYNRGLSSVWKNLNYVRNLRKENLIHITGDVHYIALALSPQKTLLTIHDIGFLKNGSSVKKNILKKIWLDFPLNRLKYISVISQATKNELVAINPKWESKIEVIHNPVNPLFTFKPTTFNDSRPRILHIGITPNKNLQRTIEALQEIKCTIVFIGILPSHIKTYLIAHKIDFEEKFNLSEEALVNEYEKCDIVSFCSLLEGFGLPIVEAQATGRIVVTSNIEPMISVAGNGAVFADPYDVSDMKKAFLSVINNSKLREEKIQNGLQNVQQFSAHHIATQYATLYQKILSKNHN